MTTIQRYLFLILTFFYLPFRGKATKTTKQRKTWVVINTTANIGDMVCTTPVFRAIKAHSPASRIIVVGIPKNEITLQGNTDVDCYISSKQSPFRIIQILRGEGVDVGIMLNFSMMELALLFLAGIPAISSFVFKKGTVVAPLSYRFVSWLTHEVEYEPGVYVPGQYLNLLKPFGIHASDIQKHLGFSHESGERVDAQFMEHHVDSHEHIVAIAPGAGTKSKQWPAERFAEVANFLSSNYKLPVVLIGGPNDAGEGENMKLFLKPHVRYVNCIGQTLDELKATLSKVALIIGNDSGSIYIAESFGKSTLVLVGPTDETEHPLNDKTHRIVKAKDRGDALLQSYVKGEDGIDLGRARSLMESISKSEVESELESLLEELGIEKRA